MLGSNNCNFCGEHNLEFKLSHFFHNFWFSWTFFAHCYGRKKWFKLKTASIRGFVVIKTTTVFGRVLAEHPFFLVLINIFLVHFLFCKNGGCPTWRSVYVFSSAICAPIVNIWRPHTTDTFFSEFFPGNIAYFLRFHFFTGLFG